MMKSASGTGLAVTSPVAMTEAIERRHEPLESAVATRPVPLPTPAVEGPDPGGVVRARRRHFGLVSRVATLLSALVIVLLVACALVPEQLAPYSPIEMQGDAVLQAPSREHWFGTDQFGRDVVSLVVHGARQSLAVGLLAVLVGCGVGASIGLLAGYAGGWVDMLAMRLIDVWMAVPNILLAVALSTALGPRVYTTILAVSLAAVPRYARVLRGQALSVKNRGFVQAARAVGASHSAILRGHVLPHCLGPIVVMATLGLGSSILLASALSFLGLGVNDDRPDWGYLLTQCRGYLTVAWWSVVFPGLALMALVVSVNLLGDAAKRWLDPRRPARFFGEG